MQEAATGGVASEGDERQPANLRVVFDGSTCAYDGPSEIGPGAASVQYMNDSDIGGAYVVLCLVDTEDADDSASYLAQPAGVTVSG